MGEGWGRGRGKEGIAVGGPHVHSHTLAPTVPPSAARVESPLRLRRESTLAAPPPHLESVCKLVLGCAPLSLLGPRHLWVRLPSFVKSQTINTQLYVEWAGYVFRTNPRPAGAPLSQVGWAELWFLAPYAPPLTAGLWLRFPP